MYKSIGPFRIFMVGDGRYIFGFRSRYLGFEIRVGKRKGEG